MNTYFLIAGSLCFLLGLVHSILGEYLIFKSKRKKGHIVPTIGNTELKGRHLRILWATWHLASFFGWCIGAFLVKIALIQEQLNAEVVNFMVNTTAIIMFVSSLLVFVATKAKHPGWIVLLLIGILAILGN